MKRNLTKMVAFAAVGLLVLSGCGNKKGSIPKDSQGRIEDMASRLPSSAEAAIFVGDIAKMRDTMNKIKTNVGSALPQVEATEKQVENELGFNPLDAESWKSAGVPESSGFTIAFVNNRTTMMVYVDDRQKFDTLLAEKLKKATDSKEAPKTETVDGVEVKIVGAGEKQIAWTHDGKLAIIATGVLDAKLGGDQASPQKFVAGLTKTEAAKSASSTPEFEQFTKGITADYALAGYVNVSALIKNPAYIEGKKEASADPAGKQFVDMFEKQAKTVGFGLTSDGNELKISGFYGADAATNKELVAFSKSSAKSPFGAFATDNILLGLRTAVDMEKSWAYYMKNMPEDQKKQIQEQLKQANQASGMDIEKDVINQLSGNIGVFFYGIDIGALMGGMNNPMAALNGLDLAIGIQFKDAKAIDKILAVATKQGGEAATPKELPEDKSVKYIAAPDGSVKLFIKDNMLLVGTKKFANQTAADALNGKATGAKLADKGGNLGKAFGSDDPYNGLYLNVNKVNAIVSALAAGNPAQKVLEKLDEASINTEATDNGGLLHIRLTLKGAAK